ncbi:hypothetical protein [Capsulimonas corticalis]|nr:hypothetical protein [Capsulimonas corticalis]
MLMRDRAVPGLDVKNRTTMDQDFDQRWRAAATPFDGVTIYSAGCAPLAELRYTLNAVFNILREQSPNAELFNLSDWHEHDGYVNEATPSSWNELQSYLISTDALKGLSTGETYVRIAIFSKHRDFLLRVYIPDAYDNPHFGYDDPNLVDCGIFDFTSTEPLALRIRDAAMDAGASDIRMMPAKEFFDKGYGG